MRAHGRRPACTRLLSLVLAVVLMQPGASARTVPADLPAPAATARRIRAIPVTSHRHYQVNAAVRPLPLPFLWIGRDRVGTADFVVHRGSDNARAYEFAGGSDPERAPGRINRWGYIAEETRSGVTNLVGVIKLSDEKSLAEVQQSIDRERASRRYAFKVYAGVISPPSVHAGDTIVQLDHDAAYRDLDHVLQMLPAETPAGLKAVSPRSGTDPGFLEAITSIIHTRVEARRSGQPVGGRSAVRCFFNNQAYQLTERSVQFVPSITIAGRAYRNVLKSELEGTQPGTSNRMPIEIVYATSGDLAEAPLRVLIQIRWWFQVELVLDPANPDTPLR